MNATSPKPGFNDLIKGSKPVLVDFSAEWCGPCKLMQPVLSELKKMVGEKATILKVDVDKNAAISSQYQIQSVPTLILYKNGTIVWRQSGVVQASQLYSILQSYFN